MGLRRTYRVGEVAASSGVSIRTLRYYHEIALLVPQGRSRAGYRLYVEDDLLRLHQSLTGLADPYEADARFSENIDKFGEGVTPFLSSAIRANAHRPGK